MSISPVRMAAGFAAALLMFSVGAAFAQGFQTTMQISPEGGGRCIDALNRELVQGQQLQMMDCSGSPAQLFTYDQANSRLSIGRFCVDANGGQPGELVRLWPCDGSTNQVWKAEPKGGFTKLAGVNGGCLDIRYGSKDSGAPLQSWNCGEAEPNQLWRLQRK
jgi:Ricin-type beta-trefoil lectin domain